MPQGTVGFVKEEGDFRVKFQGEWEQMSKQEEDWREYVKTWPEPVSKGKEDCKNCSTCFPVRANQDWKRADKTRMKIEEADEFIKKIENHKK